MVVKGHLSDILGYSGLENVYIAGPMTGIEGFNKPAFDMVAKSLITHGVAVYSPAAVINPSDRSDLLRQGLLMLAGWAKAILLLPGWEDSAGATLERNVAEELGLDVYILKG